MSDSYVFSGTTLISIPAGTTDMIVPPNTTKIGDFATSNACNTLQTVSFPSPSSLTSLLQGTFENCSLLQIVDFRNCTKLDSILSWTFRNCRSLKSVYFPDCFRQLDTECFVNTSIKSFTVPPNLIRLGSRTFCGVSSLETIDFSRAQKMTRFHSSTLAYTNIKVLDLRNCTSLKTFMQRCFSFCSLLETVYFPCTSQQITFEQLCFLNCSSLKFVYFPSCRTKIQLSASTFSHCDKLILPSGIHFMVPITQINKNHYITNGLLFTSIIISLSD